MFSKYSDTTAIFCKLMDFSIFKFEQVLLWYQGMFYESTGKQCRSGAVLGAVWPWSTMLTVSEYLG